jgi:hypothetical protein
MRHHKRLPKVSSAVSIFYVAYFSQATDSGSLKLQLALLENGTGAKAHYSGNISLFISSLEKFIQTR